MSIEESLHGLEGNEQPNESSPDLFLDAISAVHSVTRPASATHVCKFPSEASKPFLTRTSQYFRIFSS